MNQIASVFLNVVDNFKSVSGDQLLSRGRMHCKIVFNFALRHDLALLQDNRLLA